MVRFIMVLALAMVVSSQAQAFTILDSYQNIPRGTHSLGAESFLGFDDTSGVGLFGRYKYGLEEYVNVFGTIGAAGGDYGLRAGGGASFYLIPDHQGQPGISLITDVHTVRLDSSNVTLVGVAPVIHKDFQGNMWNIEPYFTVPVRLGLSGGNYEWTANWVIGTAAKHLNWMNIRMHAEVGLNASHWVDYFAIGATVRFDSFGMIEIR